MSTKMLSKIFIFFRTPHFAAYISAYIRWPVPGGPYLTWKFGIFNQIPPIRYVFLNTYVAFIHKNYIHG